jgi:CheY-like chemotaxis protein
MTKPKILIIEDFELNMKLFRTLFAQYDCTLFEAQDAEMGMEIALAHIPDLILMDIQLPGMDGLEATSLLKEHELTKHIPIITVSAYAMAEDKEAAFDAGCDGYLTKPIDSRRFIRTVLAFLPTLR